MNIDGFDHRVGRVVRDQQESVIEGLRLLTAFQNIADLTDRGILIELAERLANRTASQVTASQVTASQVTASQVTASQVTPDHVKAS